ncbi:alpha-amylase domain-containing protein [Halocatena marina]|uniref:alpha-amylase domain-containing protein n=1 Tax=Halocatena marina TaxID=2934937 RepID=UPI00200F123B|nr:alpha-amylase domain-containing protein [Halocatena marina]
MAGNTANQNSIDPKRTGEFSRRRLLKGLGVLGTVGLTPSVADSARAAPGEPVALQYFHETWGTITNNLPTVADRGYDIIWIQAPQKSRLTWADQGGRNDPPLGYQPVDFRDFNSAFGTASELQTLIDTAHSHGIEVYLDCVMNHMADGRGYDFPAFSNPDFHHCCGQIDDWNDEHEVKNGELLGLPDLEQESSYVRGELYNYMKKISDFGADGYRYDAAKHMPHWFFQDYANQWADEFGLERVGEVYDGGVSYVQAYIDTGMNAFDYPLFYTISDVFSGGDMSKLQGAGVRAQDPFHAWPFVDNHDQDGPSQYELAHAHILTSEGYPILYNIYPDWLLDNDTINNMIWVRKNLSGGETYWRYTDSNLVVYERDSNLLVGLNNSSSQQSASVTTSWANTTLHDHSGNAGDVSVAGDGSVQIAVPAEGWVFYAPT